MSHPPPEPNPYEPPRSPNIRPSPVVQAMGSILRRLLGVLAIGVASLVAFVATCLPMGFVAITQADGRGAGSGLLLALPWLIGLACAIGTGVLCFRLIFRSRRRQLPPPPGPAPGP